MVSLSLQIHRHPGSRLGRPARTPLCPCGGHRRRGRGKHGVSAGQPTDTAPSYAAVARSLLELRTAKRPKWLHIAVEFARPARPTIDANAATDVFPTTNDAPLPTAAAIGFFPIASAAAVSHAKEPAAANIMKRDCLDKTAADAHP